MSAVVFAVVVTALCLLAVGWWFGVHRRRLAESDAGVQSLANMKWRECIGLVLEALQKEGYREAPADRQPGDGGAEYLLTRNHEKVLLSYKHGTAYRIGEANVRDFANGVQLQGATNGILITLGTAEGSARDVAKRYGVQLIDGPALWPKVQGYAPVSIKDYVSEVASARTRKGLWLGAIASVALGLVTLLISGIVEGDLAASPVNAATITRPNAVLASTMTVEDPTLMQIKATARAMAAVAKLTDQQRAQRRVQAAREVSGIGQVAGAGWSTQSTLQLNLKQADGNDLPLIDEVCRILTQYEELRFTRVQLDPPESSNLAVRWRQCQ